MIENQLSTDAASTPLDWWATTDMPVRNALRTAFLIDGRMTMLEMCVQFLKAKHRIHISAWGLTPDLLMVRGKHHNAGSAGSPEQEAHLAWLRGRGIAEADLLFWQKCEELSVINVLRHAVVKGVDVRILLWDAYTLPFHAGPRQVQKALTEVGVQCLLDDSHKDLGHIIESLHQKTVVVDNRYAFVGGIDLMARSDGEFDRWDTKGHPYYSPLRQNKNGRMPHSWHDVHVLFEGPPVADVEHNFRQRWNAVIERHHLDESMKLAETVAENPLPDTLDLIRMQVTRTIPPHTYAFAEEGITSILETYQKAFQRAQRFIYIENQYFWRRTYLGIENPLLGIPHADMEQLFQSLVDALARGVMVILVLPDYPNVGRDFTDDGLHYLWEISPQAVSTGTLQVYTLGSSYQKDETVLYRPIYVHAKTTIVDDQWITVGSANLNNRGMRDDAEINVAIHHPQMAQGLRMLLMAEHLGLCDEDTLLRIVETMGRSHPTGELAHMGGEIGAAWARLHTLLSDPFKAMAAFVLQAKENLDAVKARRTLKGHLLPYIQHNQAQEYDIVVDAVKGWLGQLSPEAESVFTQDELEHMLDE